MADNALDPQSRAHLPAQEASPPWPLAPAGTSHRGTLETVLSAAKWLADLAVIFTAAGKDPSTLRQVAPATAAWTISDKTRAHQLLSKAVSSGEIQVARTDCGPTSAAIPCRSERQETCLLYLDRGAGPPLSPADLAAARAIASVAGHLLWSERHLIASHELLVQEERNRIAREIHDGVSQNLALLMLKMEIISRLADSDPTRMRTELGKVVSILEHSIQELRRAIYTLRAPDLARLGFIPALRRLANEISEQACFELVFSAPDAVDLPPEVQSGLYTAVQEWLAAVSQMGMASRVAIRLVPFADSINVHLIDNGRQAPPLPLVDPPANRWEDQIRRRIESLGGTVSIASRPPLSRMAIRVPLR